MCRHEWNDAEIGIKSIRFERIVLYSPIHSPPKVIAQSSRLLK